VLGFDAVRFVCGICECIPWCWYSLALTVMSSIDSDMTTSENGGLFVIGCQETKALVWQPWCILKPRSCLSLLIAWYHTLMNPCGAMLYEQLWEQASWAKISSRSSKLLFTNRHLQPTLKIIGAQNLNFAPKFFQYLVFGPRLCFSNKNFHTRRKLFSDNICYLCHDDTAWRYLVWKTDFSNNLGRV